MLTILHKLFFEGVFSCLCLLGLSQSFYKSLSCWVPSCMLGHFAIVCVNWYTYWRKLISWFPQALEFSFSISCFVCYDIFINIILCFEKSLGIPIFFLFLMTSIFLFSSRLSNLNCVGFFVFLVIANKIKHCKIDSFLGLRPTSYS